MRRHRMARPVNPFSSFNRIPTSLRSLHPPLMATVLTYLRQDSRRRMIISSSRFGRSLRHSHPRTTARSSSSNSSWATRTRSTRQVRCPWRRTCWCRSAQHWSTASTPIPAVSSSTRRLMSVARSSACKSAVGTVKRKPRVKRSFINSATSTATFTRSDRRMIRES